MALNNLMKLMPTEPAGNAITRQRYAEAITLLVNTAQRDTGASRVAAQIVLSAYNGHAFQLDITELTNLDATHYAAALDVIRGRAELRIEPHTVIDNGDEIFQDLWQQWQHYHCCNRHRL